MNYFNKVKDYLLDLEYQIVFEDFDEELVMVSNEEEGVCNVVIDCEDPILVIEALLFEVESASKEILESLLQKNRELVHGAFALDETGTKVIFRDTLQLENLDLNELEGSLNALKLLLVEHADELIQFSKN